MNKIDLRKERKKLKLTQVQLADMLGVTRETIVNYERGHTIPKARLKMLESLLEKGNIAHFSEPNPETTNDDILRMVTDLHKELKDLRKENADLRKENEGLKKK